MSSPPALEAAQQLLVVESVPSTFELVVICVCANCLLFVNYFVCLLVN